jgi:hypothetical protein
MRKCSSQELRRSKNYAELLTFVKLDTVHDATACVYCEDFRFVSVISFLPRPGCSGIGVYSSTQKRALGRPMILPARRRKLCYPAGSTSIPCLAQHLMTGLASAESLNEPVQRRLVDREWRFDKYEADELHDFLSVLSRILYALFKEMREILSKLFSWSENLLKGNEEL